MMSWVNVLQRAARDVVRWIAHFNSVDVAGQVIRSNEVEREAVVLLFFKRPGF